MNHKHLLFLLPLSLIFGCITGSAVVSSGDRVSIEYVMRVQNQTIGRNSISFVVNEHSVIPGLEAGVIGMNVGEVKELTIPPSLAYGEYEEDLVVPLPREVFNQTQPSLYDEVTMFGKKGMIVNISNDWVIVDLNHWLAGEYINFTIKLLTLEKA